MTTERNQTLMDQSISPVTEKRSRTASTASSPKKRKSTSLPVETVEYLKAWMMSPEHVAHPYPTEQEKAKIMADTGIELKQLTNWFVNNRKRFWKPRVEGKLQKQQTGSLSSSLPQVVSTNSVSALLEKDRLQSPVDRFISASSSDDESLATDSSLPGPVMMEEPLSHQEMLPVHILHHSGSSPTLQDVSVLSNIPQERILQTFRAIIRYNKEKRGRREAEIARIKKHYLKVYLDQQQQMGVTLKRSLVSDEPMPRPKFRRVSVQLWKDACKSAPCYDHETLPTLEEASQLFGFAAN